MWQATQNIKSRILKLENGPFQRTSHCRYPQQTRKRPREKLLDLKLANQLADVATWIFTRQKADLKSTISYMKLCNWMPEFLTNRPGVTAVMLNTGAPQGSVLGPLLFTLRTHKRGPRRGEMTPGDRWCNSGQVVSFSTETFFFFFFSTVGNV